METNQELVKELIGNENYENLADNGFIAMEISNVKTLVEQAEKVIGLVCDTFSNKYENTKY